MCDDRVARSLPAQLSGPTILLQWNIVFAKTDSRHIGGLVPQTLNAIDLGHESRMRKRVGGSRQFLSEERG